MSVKTHGIDVSQWNGAPDWDKLKGNIDFAILRTGIGKASPSQVDREIKQNYAECERLGIPVGVYHYSYALTPEAAREEADFCLSIIKDMKLAYPVYYDVEEKAHSKLSPEQLGAVIKAFCDRLEEAGYWVGVYSFDSLFAPGHIPASVTSRYASWVARVDRSPVYSTKHCMWQHTWKNRYEGISGDVDGDICTMDYPTMIKHNGLNGFTINAPKPPKTYLVTAAKSGVAEDKLAELVTGLKSQGFMVTTKEE